MGLVMRKFAQFSRMPRAERKSVLEALLYLVLARVLVFAPFRWVAPLLGRTRPGTAPISPCNSTQRVVALEVRKAVLRVANNLPWHSSCLVQAIAALFMIARRRLPSTLELGVRRGGSMELAAHAWLRCGDVDIVGTETAADFPTIVAFVNE